MPIEAAWTCGVYVTYDDQQNEITVHNTNDEPKRGYVHRYRKDFAELCFDFERFEIPKKSSQTFKLFSKPKVWVRIMMGLPSEGILERESGMMLEVRKRDAR